MPRKILIVEDFEPIGRMLVRLFACRGDEAIHCCSVAEATIYLENESAIREFHGAILDIVLSDGDGIDLYKTIRRIRRDLRIVIYSSYPEIGRLSDLGSGPIVLEKPVRFDDLYLALFPIPSV